MSELQSTLTDCQQRIERLLKEQLDQQVLTSPRLKDAMQYALLNGGKRMRPFLLYATGNMLGAKTANCDPLAMAIECIHSYSLVHDDLPAMDDDDLRRGKPTCHIAFDEATAILAGDALQTMAFEILANASLQDIAPLDHLKLLKILSHSSGYQGMCGGQALDLAATGKRVDQVQLEHVHQLKTGALIRASVSMAATISPDCDSNTIIQLDLFSKTLGLAFQVRDDILDVESDSQTLGKPQGSDQNHDKSTYPSLMGLQAAKNYLDELHQQALHALDALPYNTAVLKDFTDLIVNRNH